MRETGQIAGPVTGDRWILRPGQYETVIENMYLGGNSYTAYAAPNPAGDFGSKVLIAKRMAQMWENPLTCFPAQ